MERARQPSEGSLKCSVGPPWITHTQVFTNALLRKSSRALFSHSPLHLFIPFPRSSFFPCLSESESSEKEKKKERKTAWVNLSRETSSGSFSFFKRTPPDLMFNLWRRTQAWYVLAWQAESIFDWETWIGPDQGWCASLRQGPGEPQTGQQLGAKSTLSLEPERG